MTEFYATYTTHIDYRGKHSKQNPQKTNEATKEGKTLTTKQSTTMNSSTWLGLPLHKTSNVLVYAINYRCSVLVACAYNCNTSVFSVARGASTVFVPMDLYAMVKWLSVHIFLFYFVLFFYQLAKRGVRRG